MSRFVENAARILEAAESATRSGHALSEMSVLISSAGGIQLVADSDWPLASLQAHHGAQMAFRVSQQANRLRLEGREGSRTCLFETAKPNGAFRLLLADSPRYTILPAPRALAALV